MEPWNIAFTVSQVALSALLVIVTWRYVKLTGTLAHSAHRQLEMTTTPNLVPYRNLKSGSIHLVNLSSGPVSISRYTASYEIYGRPRAKTQTGQVVSVQPGDNGIIIPNGWIIEAYREHTAPDAALPGTWQIDLEFFYGPAGSRKFYQRMHYSVSDDTVRVEDFSS